MPFSGVILNIGIAYGTSTSFTIHDSSFHGAINAFTITFGKCYRIENELPRLVTKPSTFKPITLTRHPISLYDGPFLLQISWLKVRHIPITTSRLHCLTCVHTYWIFFFKNRSPRRLKENTQTFAESTWDIQWIMIRIVTAAWLE